MACASRAAGDSVKCDSSQSTTPGRYSSSVNIMPRSVMTAAGNEVGPSGRLGLRSRKAAAPSEKARPVAPQTSRVASQPSNLRPNLTTLDNARTPENLPLSCHLPAEVEHEAGVARDVDPGPGPGRLRSELPGGAGQRLHRRRALPEREI